ncbi:hypothetical protein K227x_53190 [Rubripirellula lacrimiformis]|uniref:Uncharacterized protein n=1 Tax=Rubripirellula lacrimiformis TaxID=1930273 RepID=A0A517NID6_9BACT|nr:hypothetical protein [Rubripirellula lacrimiformis]QDT06896.1 hypothetical protein K227x_53190 [Rubripirellula lacrimiformis]
MIATSLLDDCRRLAFTVAPELEANPLYVVDAETLAGTPNPADCLGFARRGNWMDYETIDRIGDAWTGPGPLIALDGEVIRESHGENFTAAVTGTMVHELAHILPAIEARELSHRQPGDKMDCDAVRQNQAVSLSRSIAKPAAEPGSCIDPHNDQFIRRTCHVYSRAVAHGWDVSIDGLFGGSLWFACQPAHWITSLLPELHSMRTASFAEIETATPPEAFTKLWQSSLDLYRSFQDPRGDIDEQI